jgi:hypothetical protein
MYKFIIIILIIILLLILLCDNKENFNVNKEIEKEEKNKINTEIIYLLSNEILIIETLMIKNMLLKLGLNSEIIFNLDKINYEEDNFYIIIYPNNRIIPKNYIFWQINDLLIDDLYNNSYFVNLLDDSVSIFDIYPNNLSYYKDKIKNKKKIRYCQLPFCNISNINVINNNYDYDILFFGKENQRIEKILNIVEEKLGKKYKFLFLLDKDIETINNHLLKTKYLLNFNENKNSHIKFNKFNTAINYNCLILSENSINEDEANKYIYKYFVDYFDIIDDNTNIDKLIEFLEYNLKDDVFYYKKNKYLIEKQKLEDTFKFYMHKNLLSLFLFDKLDININFNIESPIYCISLIEDDSRYKKMLSNNKNIINHIKFPAFKHNTGHIGCAMSYYTIFYNSKRLNLDTITIFEDDVLFKNNFQNSYSIIKDFLNHIKWDVFNGFCCLIENEKDIVEYYIHKGIYILKLKKMFGMVFNIYNKSIYDKFLIYDYNYSNNNPNDILYQIDRIINKFDYNIFISYPNLVSILPIKSSLDVFNDVNEPELKAYNWYIDTEKKTGMLIENYIKNNKPKYI